MNEKWKRNVKESDVSVADVSEERKRSVGREWCCMVEWRSGKESRRIRDNEM